MDRTFPMGIGLWDLGKYRLAAFVIAIIVLLLAMAVPMSLIVLMSGDLLVGAIVFMFVFGVFAVASLMAGSLVLVMLFVQVMLVQNRCKNYTVVTDKEIIAYKQDGIFNPVIKNSMDRSSVWRIERADRDYFDQRWKITPLWLKMNFMHKYPQGGLYYPFTNRKNLLVLYLDEPVMFTNREVNFFMMRGPGFLRTLPVKEVVLDIRAADQKAFVSEVFGADRGPHSDENN